MGHGSGGSAASLLALSPEGRSATGVAALSGTPLSPGAVRSDPAEHANALANHTSCPTKPPERLVLCLRQMPVEKIVLADEDIKMDGLNTMVFLDDISGRSGAGARVEGADDLRGLPPIVVEKPAESLNKKEKRCPMLTGVTSAETAKAVYGKKTAPTEAYSTMLQKDLLGGLQSVVKQVEGLIPLTDVVNQVLPLDNYYQAVFDASANAVDGLSEIAEATGECAYNYYQAVFEASANAVDGLSEIAEATGECAYNYYQAVFDASANAVDGLSEIAEATGECAYNYYQAVFEASANAVDGLSEIAEATGDALFNFPAFATVKSWSTGGDAFLYSFEHVGNLSKGSFFLPGMALTAHGDELAYLFEPLDSEGQSMASGVMSSTDARVRDNFVGLIAKFARGASETEDKKKGGKGLFDLPLSPFSKTDEHDQFLKITDSISVEKDFR
ncbi:Carboxylesterase [Operophtera brumata]|uniref:Carboxylesterase n=1 Tax=Operophtera brumata TaxID=104452 RepID=A0A0L7KQX8_OPEBR|nr:Carboxylesterase [Operophtera brumata]